MSIPESELSYGSILTLTGENAEINGKLNNKPINFTHIVIGDANDVYVQPSRTQTALVNEITRIPVTGMEKITPSEPDGVPQLKVWAKIPDDIVDIAVREFAAVATFDGDSYLHAVGNSVRIPILSGSNNGGEVNDIFIEMTFSVTSLEPIVMIDPNIVTASKTFVNDSIFVHNNSREAHPDIYKEIRSISEPNVVRNASDNIVINKLNIFKITKDIVLPTPENDCFFCVRVDTEVSQHGNKQSFVAPEHKSIQILSKATQDTKVNIIIPHVEYRFIYINGEWSV